MKWLPWGRKKQGSREETQVDDKLCAAEKRAQELEDRSSRVAESLHGRLGRNHWGEAVAEIARRERHNPC